MAEKAVVANVQAGAPVFTDEALKAGMVLAAPKEVPGYHPFVVIPPGATVSGIPNFRIPTKDDHRKAQVKLTDAKSLINYINTYGGADTILFANDKAGCFSAMLDYHQKGEAGEANWREHSAVLLLTHTQEWTTWIVNNKKSFNQVEFAEFLESNLLDIFEPNGTEILEAATTLSSKRDVNFSSSTRLADGTTKFTYEETNSEKGLVRLPEMFVLGLAPFKGIEPFKLQARLRYRINSGKLTFFYDLLRHEKVIEKAIDDVAAQIEQGTNLNIYRGSL